MGLFSGLFGGGGSSSSSSSTTTTTNIDKRQVNDGSSVGVTSDQSTVNVATTYTDYGSVDKALALVRDANQRAIDLSGSNTQAVGQSIGQVLGFAEKALTLTKENINLAIKNTDQIGTAYKTVGDLSTGNRTLATLGLIAGGIVAVFALGRKKG